MTNASAKGKRHRGRLAVNPEMLLHYIHLLNLGKASFHNIWTEFRTQKGYGGGPDETTWRRILRQKWVSEDLGPSLLECFRQLLLDAYERKVLTPEQLPMMVSLAERPEPPSEEMSRPGVASEHVKPMSWAECFDELCRLIRESTHRQTLYASVGTGFELTRLLESLGEDGRGVIGIVMRKLSDPLIVELEKLGLIPKNFQRSLECSIAWLESRKRQNFVPLSIWDWVGMAPFHGMMYGDVIFCGAWQYDCAGLNPGDPMFKLIAKNKPFELYRLAFMQENGGKAYVPRPSWCGDGKVLWERP